MFLLQTSRRSFCTCMTILAEIKGTEKFLPHPSRAQAASQGVQQVLLLGPGGWDPKLFAGLLQHRHCQLPQGAVLQVGPQLVFWHLHFGLLLGSASAIGCDSWKEMKGQS